MPSWKEIDITDTQLLYNLLIQTFCSHMTHQEIQRMLKHFGSTVQLELIQQVHMPDQGGRVQSTNGRSISSRVQPVTPSQSLSRLSVSSSASLCSYDFLHGFNITCSKCGTFLVKSICFAFKHIHRDRSHIETLNTLVCGHITTKF